MDRNKLVEMHRLLMDISVKGSDVEKMYKVLVALTDEINSMPVKSEEVTNVE